jgi:hypothetical protein
MATDEGGGKGMFLEKRIYPCPSVKSVVKKSPSGIRGRPRITRMVTETEGGTGYFFRKKEIDPCASVKSVVKKSLQSSEV